MAISRGSRVRVATSWTDRMGKRKVYRAAGRGPAGRDILNAGVVRMKKASSGKPRSQPERVDVEAMRARVLAELPPDSIEAEIVRLFSDVPDEESDKLPSDGSINLDHYLYGAPRKP